MRYAFEPVISVPSNSTKFLRLLHVFTKGRKGESEGTSLIFRLRLRSNPRHTTSVFHTDIFRFRYFTLSSPFLRCRSDNWEKILTVESLLAKTSVLPTVLLAQKKTNFRALGSVAWYPYQDFLTEFPFLKWALLFKRQTAGTNWWFEFKRVKASMLVDKIFVFAEFAWK